MTVLWCYWEQILAAQGATGGDTGCWAVGVNTWAHWRDAESIASRHW